MAAADVENGDRAGQIGLYTAFTLVTFWLAHVYSALLGDWSGQGVQPTVGRARKALIREWPMLGATTVPLLILVMGAVDLLPDHLAINTALAVCVGELGLTSFYAARRGGASLKSAVLAVALALVFGVAIVLLKAIIHR
ncbi:MAG: hypothetical protein F2799_03700 [Actinobacteria bacterium]|uniref:Unannotated protein n=1 Tax=freshwater metagenome TaxID=449393 RepID=A0A6J7DJU3_9ZZZZ|nr:hypothetical protein [Actinomycetota bacterium]